MSTFTPDLFLAIFLPALLFEAAYHVEFSKFRRNAVIMLLAIPGVVLSVVVTALLSWPLLSATGALRSCSAPAFCWRP